ncbi:MAG: SH3 domain-containing protein, partial [Chloroflexota bacterium]
MRRWTRARGATVAVVVMTTLLLLIAPAQASGDLSVGSGATVTADWLNLRGGPGLGNPIVDELANGTSLQILGGPINSAWWRVTDGSRVGYVDGDWLAPGAASVDQATYDLDLALPYHRQLTSIWCDPADLQTWVEYLTGQSLGDSYTAQQSFWSWELGHNDGFTVQQWDASPFAVASAAHHWLPSRGFNHFIYDDPLAATSMVAWLLANPSYHEPSVATIWWGDHYVLVRGVRATADPYRDYSQAKILGVYVMDPNRGRPSWLGEDRYI